MYSRFLRWASDRIDENGIIAFITNRSYTDSRTFDGFRKTVAKEFDDIYIVDTQSDVRKNPKIAGTTHNVFGIQTGVAVMFLTKTASNKKKKARIHYFTLTDEMRKREKLEWFRDNKIENIPFQRIKPDKQNNWLNITDNDFDDLLLLVKNKNSLFKLSFNGIVTNRDEWVYDFDKVSLKNKIKFLLKNYNNSKIFNNQIKWSESLKRRFRSNKN